MRSHSLSPALLLQQLPRTPQLPLQPLPASQWQRLRSQQQWQQWAGHTLSRSQQPW